METWISVKDLSDLAGVPESTARRYVRAFSQFFRFQELGRVVKYDPECATILEEISKMYSLGMDSERIADTLADRHPIILDYKLDDNHHELPPVATTKGALAVALEQMAATMQQLVEQQEEIAQLKKEVSDLREAQSSVEQEVKAAVAEAGAAWQQEESKLEEIEIRLSRVESKRNKKWWWPF